MPPVHPEVAEILRKSKPQKVGDKWHKPKISARRLADLRKQCIAKGYYWPEKPMVDRGLDRMPKGHKYEKRKEERCVTTLPELIIKTYNVVLTFESVQN